MPVAFERIEPLLLKVEKPGRYVGGEFNQIVKEGSAAAVRCCLAFPDVYDLGMSYHGYNILYERLNRNPHWAIERAFTPWPDFEALLREHQLPLTSLETRRALSEFDVVGFTLQHEVNYTNILTMLDLGGVPVESADRTAIFPLIIGGGEGAYSPEPMSPFMDAFVIGDGEEALEDICRMVEQAKSEDWNRDAILFALSQIAGVYVPQFYDVEYLDDGRVKSVKPNREGVLPVIKKRHFNITQDLGSVRPVVPLLRTVHDRFAIEIRRGCVNGCRFCQAGMITRPVRERSVDQICQIAAEGIANTGYDEISLLSLSSADYTAIGTLVRRMSREFGPHRVSVSLPSLRINAFDVDIADEIRGVRKSGFTFAPEAGTDRLRKVINKEVDQEEFFHIIEEVFKRGWQTVKFYFMIGLPTETDEDLDGIVEITQRAAQIGRKHHNRKAIVNVTLSPFVPKSNTPFMWEPQPPEEELKRRYDYVRRKLRGPNIDVKTNDTGSAFIEAALARGDRRVSAVLKTAWQMGCRFDGWDEYFRHDLWLEAFRRVGLDPAFYASRQRLEDEVFPFDHIDSSLGKRFLWADQRRAWRLRVMEPCEVGKCAGCVACTDVIDHILARSQPGATEGMERYTKEAITSRAEKEERLAAGRELDDPSQDSTIFTAAKKYRERAEEQAQEEQTDVFTHYRRRKLEPVHRFAEPEKAQRVRVTYTKLGNLRYIAHLDLAKAVAFVLRRAGVKLSYSEGFNTKPKIQFAPPLSLGVGGRAELFDAVLTERVDLDEMLQALNAASVPGLEFLKAEEVDIKAESVESGIEASVFVAMLSDREPRLRTAEIGQKLSEFFATPEFPVDVKKKDGIRRIDLRRSLLEAEVCEVGTGAEVRLTITHEEGLFVQPQIALGFILGQPVALGIDARFDREGVVLSRETAIA